MISRDAWGLIDNRDAAHNGAFYAYALMDEGYDIKASIIFDPIKYTLFGSTFYPYKHPTYKFSNSQDWRKVLYRLIFKRFGVDPYCGSNGDQMEPVAYVAARKKDVRFLLKLLLGFVLRLGFYPNGEHILWKVGILRTMARFFRLKPLYWLLDMHAYFGYRSTILTPIDKETTKKIRLFLYLRQAKDQPTYWSKKILNTIRLSPDYLPFIGIDGWFFDVFSEYWKEGTEKYEIVEKLDFEALL